ncbi:MAG: hypothetical protein HUJ75_07955, partial [Parasporobacterium sp.]|nr:hypothetical protein [Parasporobacterium sp.]
HGRNIEELLPLINNGITNEDLKKMEENFRQIIQKLNSSSQSKFAEKNETKKVLNSLEAQIKEINEINKEKKETCMLASKPVGGYKCASCETYIGDINNKNEYLPWNKYQGEKKYSQYQYRIGSGFSRLLKSFNFYNKRNAGLKIETFKNFTTGNSFDDNCIGENKYLNNLISPIYNRKTTVQSLDSTAFDRNLNSISVGNMSNESNIPMFTDHNHGDEYNSRLYKSIKKAAGNPAAFIEQ